jgi:hypothetical protein
MDEDREDPRVLIQSKKASNENLKYVKTRLQIPAPGNG